MRVRFVSVCATVCLFALACGPGYYYNYSQFIHNSHYRDVDCFFMASWAIMGVSPWRGALLLLIIINRVKTLHRTSIPEPDGVGSHPSESNEDSISRTGPTHTPSPTPLSRSPLCWGYCGEVQWQAHQVQPSLSVSSANSMLAIGYEL